MSMLKNLGAYSLRWAQRFQSEQAAPETKATLADALFAVTLALLVYGVTMVYSASAVFAGKRYGTDTYFMTRQLSFCVLGLILMWGVKRIGLETFQKHLPKLWMIGAVVLILVLIPGIGKTAGGARRWLPIAGIPIQPAEFAKILVILLMAHAIARKEARALPESHLWKMALWSQLFVFLVLCERDFGTTVILELLVVLMLFLGGARLGWLIAFLAACVPIAVYLVQKSPYRMRRVNAFWDPFSDRRGAGYQLGEALISIGSGGPFGTGLGDSRQKLYFLPEAHTDFIFAIIGEELGFLGVLLLIALFAAYLGIAFAIARRAKSLFARNAVLGLSFWIVLQAAINMCVATGLLPTKGLTLPFISSGGSSLLSCLVATGLIMSVVSAPERAAPGVSRGRN